MTGISFAEDVTVSWEARRGYPSPSRLMLTAFLISVGVHVVVAVGYRSVPTDTTQLPQQENQSVRISLIPRKIIEPIDSIKLLEPVESVDTSPPQTLPAVQQTISEPGPSEPAPPIEKLPPSSQDIQTAIRRTSVLPDRYRLPDDLAPPQVQPDDTEGIFNPHLRKKLQAAESRRTEIISASTESTTIHGGTVVKLDEERCMSSDNRRNDLTRANDWYFINCNNTKTEGELIMDRIKRRAP